MCDIDAKDRRERYHKLREAGVSYSFSVRARDFTDIRFIQALNKGKRPTEKQIKKQKKQRVIYKGSCLKCDGKKPQCICIRKNYL